MTRVMSDHQMQEWLDHPASNFLKAVLIYRKDQIVQDYLAGRPVDPLRQGQAVAFQLVLQLLDLPPDQLMAQPHHKDHQQDQ